MCCLMFAIVSAISLMNLESGRQQEVAIATFAKVIAILDVIGY